MWWKINDTMKSDTTKSNYRSFFLRLSATVLIFSLIFWLLPMGDVWQAMTKVGWWRWLLVLLAFGIGHAILAYKWYRLVGTAGTPFRYGIALRAHMAGLFANIWLPSIIGGDVVRAGLISRQQGVAVPTITGLLDRLLDLMALSILAACGMLLSGSATNTMAGNILSTVGVVAMLGIPLLLFTLPRLRPGHLPGAIRTPGTRLIEVFRTLYNNPKPAGNSLLLALVVQLAFVVLNYFLAVAMGIGAPFAAWLMAWPLAKIAALLPVSLGGLGVREVALAALLTPFAVSSTLAIAQALVWQSVLFGFGLLAGLGVLLSKPLFKPGVS